MSDNYMLNEVVKYWKLTNDLLVAIGCELDKFERAVILLWLDENSYEEIAEIVGVPRNTVASKLKRIKDKLTKQANS